MKKEQLVSLFDFFPEEELKKFEKEDFILRESRVYTNNLNKLSKMFWFTTKEEADLWLQVDIGKNVPFDQNYCMRFGVSAFYDNHWTDGMDEIFLAHQYKLIEPFTHFFDEKIKEMEKYLKTDKTMRMRTLYQPINFYNYTKESYQNLRAYYEDPHYQEKRGKLIERFKKMKIIH